MINKALVTRKFPYLLLSGFLLLLFLISNRFGFITLLMLWSIITLLFVSLSKYTDKTGLLIIFFSIVYSICGILTGSMVTYTDILPTALPMFSFYIFGKLIVLFESSVLKTLNLTGVVQHKSENFKVLLKKIRESEHGDFKHRKLIHVTVGESEYSIIKVVDVTDTLYINNTKSEKYIIEHPEEETESIAE